MWRSAKILLACCVIFFGSIVACYRVAVWQNEAFGDLRSDATRAAMTPTDWANFELASRVCDGSLFVAFGAFVVGVASLGAVLGRTHGWYHRRREQPRVVARGFEVIR